jgi:flavodoxin
MAGRILVVCFSRTGATLRVAAHVADALGADLDRIEENGSRSGFIGYARSLLEAVAKGLPTIQTRRDPREYDLVVIGTPVWAGTMSSPVRAYLHAHAGQFKNVACFAVMGGQGATQTVREMQLLCGAPDALTQVFTERDVELNEYRKQCEPWLEALRNAFQARGARQQHAVA